MEKARVAQSQQAASRQGTTWDQAKTNASAQAGGRKATGGMIHTFPTMASLISLTCHVSGLVRSEKHERFHPSALIVWPGNFHNYY